METEVEDIQKQLPPHDHHTPHRVRGAQHELHRHASNHPTFLTEYAHTPLRDTTDHSRQNTPIRLDTEEHHRYENNRPSLDALRFQVNIKHDLDELVEFVDTFEDFHNMDALDVTRNLQVDPEKGLTLEQVERRREEFGDNSLGDGTERFLVLKIIAKQLINALTIILLTVFVIAVVFEEWVEAVVVMLILIVNASIGSVQEIKSVKSLNAISSMADNQTARVIRNNGALFTIPIEEIVLGDVVEIRQGDCAPADLRLIQSERLQMDEALLTGESQPVDKHTSSCDVDTPLADRAQMVYRQTHASEGHARGIAVAIGINTEIGLIAARLSQDQKTPPIASVQQTLSWLLYILFGVGVVMGVFILWAFDWKFDAESLVFASAALVAILPEASVVLATMILALGVKRMAKANSIVKESLSVERIGRVTDICSDKTGTLTEGKMRAGKFVLIDPNGDINGGLNVEAPADSATGEWSEGKGAVFQDLDDWLNIGQKNKVRELGARSCSFDSDAEFKVEKEAIVKPGDSVHKTIREETFDFAMLIASLCSATELEEMDDGRLVGLGNPTEKALQALTHQAGFKRRDLKSTWELRGEYGFDSTVKTMLVGYRHRVSGRSLVLMKGAPERILDGWVMGGCVGGISPEEQKKIEDEKKEKILETIQGMAKQGLRVLALAYREDLDFSVDTLCDFEREDVEKEVHLVGLVGLRDPPKQETPGAVEECRGAGIVVRMLTGDHPDTAAAIAAEIGILQPGWEQEEEMLRAGSQGGAITGAIVMTGKEIDGMTDDELYSLDPLPLVVARCSPMSKVRMVEALHEKGRAVAMTGDGVNDAPAIKEADVGVAMGITGSDVTKSVGDIVLADDNFATIVVGVREGRRMQHSIRSVVSHLLCANIAEAIAIMLALSFAVDDDGVPVYIMGPLAILWVNVVSVSLPALALARDSPPGDLMSRPPKMGSFLTKSLIFDVLLYGTVMGAFALSIFTIVIWGEGDGEIGDDCNKGSGIADDTDESCDNVGRARGATFILLNTLLLIHSLNCRHETASTTLHAIRTPNLVLMGAIVVGIVLAVPLLYIPVISDELMKHKGITWEWGLVVGFVFLFILFSEVFMFIRRILQRRSDRKRLGDQTQGKSPSRFSQLDESDRELSDMV